MTAARIAQHREDNIRVTLDQLDGDARAAVGHLDDDLRAVEAALTRRAADPLSALTRLRRRAVAAYRTALAEAAGVVADVRWTRLAVAVSAFVALVAAEPDGHDARAAMTRLHRLVAENSG
jgi:hypothetical protein